MLCLLTALALCGPAVFSPGLFSRGALQAAAAEGAVGEETGRAMPRFVSLAASEVNLRTGPGEQYPVTWKFVRQGLPVEVVAEYELWRRVRAGDGTVGWVHKNLLSGRRTAIIQGQTAALLADHDAAAPVVLRAEAGVQGRLLKCRLVWCEMEIAGRRGWLLRDHIWGVYPGEDID
jgi:SH3-like domain-containing protein